jgi:predicted nucleic acid-binding protein
MIFADTSFLISLFRENDEYNARAVRLSKEIDQRVVITSEILVELVTFILRKDGKETAYRIGKKIIESDVIIIYIGDDDIPDALQYVKRYEGLSMCDALSAVVMKKIGIKKILSFDSDFDKLNLERVF